jgi:hypothetical protein
MMHEDPNDVPQAYSTAAYKCEECENLHLILYDDDDNAIATAVLTRQTLIDMLKLIDGKIPDGYIR